MVFCADCGRAMEFERLPHGAEESKKVCYYICKARQADDKCIGHQIPEKLLKALIMDQLHLFIVQLSDVPVMDFVDDGYTGSNFDRPGFQQMMDGVRNGKIDTIIVKDLSRFGRDYVGVGEYMEQIFPLLGVRLIAINDNYDSNNYKGTTLGMDVVVSNLVNAFS